jgi:hypothetical protein
MTSNQVLRVFVLVVAVLAIIELFDMSNYANKANFLLFYSLRHQVNLVQVSVHSVRTDVVLFLLLLFQPFLGLTSLCREKVIRDFPAKHVAERPQPGGEFWRL